MKLKPTVYMHHLASELALVSGHIGSGVQVEIVLNLLQRKLRGHEVGDHEGKSGVDLVTLGLDIEEPI